MARVALDAFLSGHSTQEKPLLVAMEPLASRVGGMDFGVMQSDPANWASCLSKTGRLLNLSGLILGFDHSLSLATFGAEVESGDAAQAKNVQCADDQRSTALEAFNRITQTERAHYGCMACLSGPIGLAQTLYADIGRAGDLKQTMVELAEAFCKSRPDLLIFREGAALGNTAIGMPERKVYNTLKNMASYFNVPLAIYLEQYDSQLLPDLAKLKVNFVLLGADKNGAPPELNSVRELAANVTGVGLPLPFNDPERAVALATEYETQLSGVNYLYTSMQELTRDTDLEKARMLISTLQH
ncbi:MAG: hypothetical protein H6995_09700 [Pseudomonadales bacterium]|nr:hypothetical protein [Pseudomonadales bacterium]MCP5215268.1 hypothetical protein [Pseudomonadales bacterium]